MPEPAKPAAPHILVRNYTRADIPELLEIQMEAFPPPYPQEQLWSEEQLLTHLAVFPDGCHCAEVDGVIAGSGTSLIVAFDPDGPDHTWAEVTDNGYIRTHNPEGDTLYGVDICVRPAYRRAGVARAIYRARFDLVVRLNLKRFVAGGRIPGYHRHAAALTPEEYLHRVVAGELTDPVLTPQIKSGMRPIRVIHDYLPDEESANCAVLIEWPNPLYDPSRRKGA